MNQREASRNNWRLNGEHATVEEINAGSLQRIADAVEKMTKRWDDLVRDRDAYKAMHEREQNTRRRIERRVIALRGHITRLKRRGAP